MPKFSIVMPLLMQRDYQYRITLACIKNIEAFSYDYELIVLHSMASFMGKDVEKLLRKNDKYISFKNNPSQVEVLNKAIEISKGEYIILIGNDNFVHQDWLLEIDKRLDNPEFQILGCSVDRVLPEEVAILQEKYPDGIKSANFSYLNFQGLTIKKTILDDVGPFDPKLPFYYWERDYDLRLEDRGIKVGAVLNSYMTTPQSMTRLDWTLPKGIKNWWSDEAMEKEINYYKQKWGSRVS